MTKEEVYDAEINPLMAQIIAICKREKIALLANFRLDEDLMCTSALLEPEYGPSKEQLSALKLIKEGYLSFAFTVAGGSRAS